MSVVSKAYGDLVCDHPGCDADLSGYTDQGYPVGDHHWMREDAQEYDWQRTEDGRDLCPDHRSRPAEEVPDGVAVGE